MFIITNKSLVVILNSTIISPFHYLFHLVELSSLPYLKSQTPDNVNRNLEQKSEKICLIIIVIESGPGSLIIKLTK